MADATDAASSDAGSGSDDSVTDPTETGAAAGEQQSSGDDEEAFKEQWPDDVPIMATATHQEYQVNIDPELTDLLVTANTVDDWETILAFYNDSMPGWTAGEVTQVGPDDDIVHRQASFTDGDREVTVTLTGDETRNFLLGYVGPKN